MPTPAATADTSRIYGQLLVTTAENIHPGIRENYLNAHPVLSLFCGRIGDVLSGRIGDTGTPTGSPNAVSGESIRVNVKLGANESFSMLPGGYSPISMDTSDPDRGTRANFKLGAGSVVISGSELRKNSGEAQVADLLLRKQNDAVSAAADNIAEQLLASTSGANDVTSLLSIISNGDSLQGYSGATYTGWNARGTDGSGTFASGSFATQGLADMRKADNQATEGSMGPKAIVTTLSVHEFYEGSLTPNVRFEDTRMGDLGFNALTFRRKPVFFDRYCPSGTMLFIDTDCTMVKHLPGALFDLTPMERGTNQDAFVAHVIFEGNLVTDSRRTSNKLTGITA